MDSTQLFAGPWGDENSKPEAFSDLSLTEYQVLFGLVRKYLGHKAQPMFLWGIREFLSGDRKYWKHVLSRISDLSKYSNSQEVLNSVSRLTCVTREDQALTKFQDGLEAMLTAVWNADPPPAEKTERYLVRQYCLNRLAIAIAQKMTS